MRWVGSTNRDRGGLALIQRPSRGEVLSEVAPVDPAPTGMLLSSLEGWVTNDREGAGKSVLVFLRISRTAGVCTTSLRCASHALRFGRLCITPETVSGNAVLQPPLVESPQGKVVGLKR